MEFFGAKEGNLKGVEPDRKTDRDIKKTFISEKEKFS